MHTQIYQKFLFHFSLFGLFVSVVIGFYDVILHYSLAILHFFAEIIEQTLDKLVEEFFDTDLHETQIIVFYIMLIVGGIFTYIIWKLLVELVKELKYDAHADWTDLKTAVISDWQSLSTLQKTAGIVLFLVINYLFSFLLF
jgi:hypothetical protein